MNSSDTQKYVDLIKTTVRDSVLCWLATVDSSGKPNVSPKEIFSFYGDNQLVIADIASNGSVQNIRYHPYVCVSLVDVFRQCGLKISGTARIVLPTDPEFSVVGAECLSMVGNKFTIRCLICIGIDDVSRILAPSYIFHPEESEEEKRQNAYKAYGVQGK